MQGARLGITVCPEPTRWPQNQRRSVLQQLERRVGRFALEAAGLILPAGATLGAAETWQLLGGYQGGAGAVVGNGCEMTVSEPC